MAPLHYAAKFDPFFSLDCAGLEGGREGGRKDQILSSGNTGHALGVLPAVRDQVQGAQADRRAADQHLHVLQRGRRLHGGGRQIRRSDLLCCAYFIIWISFNLDKIVTLT